MKGTITLQPIRKEKLEIKGWPVFGKEDALYGFLKSKTKKEITLSEGDKIKLEDAHEFMVKLENDSVVQLDHKNIDEAMGNDWWDYYSFHKNNVTELDFKVKKGVATVLINPVEIKSTERGFALGQFIDQYGLKCSIQKSSLATKDCIWLGVEDVTPKILASDAVRLGINTSKKNGWIEYPIPEEVLLSSRMHLSREDVKKILPLLNKFAETGEL